MATIGKLEKGFQIGNVYKKKKKNWVALMSVNKVWTNWMRFPVLEERAKFTTAMIFIRDCIVATNLFEALLAVAQIVNNLPQSQKPRNTMRKYH